jgi:hypothetical protein
LNFSKRQKPCCKVSPKEKIVKNPSTKRGGSGAEGAETTGDGGGKVGKSSTSEGKEFGALLNPSRPIRSAKALINIIEEEYPQLLFETSRSPAGQQTKERIAKQRINFNALRKPPSQGMRMRNTTSLNCRSEVREPNKTSAPHKNGYKKRQTAATQRHNFYSDTSR